MNFVYEDYGSFVLRDVKKPERIDYSFRCIEELFVFLGSTGTEMNELRNYFTYKSYSKNEAVFSTETVADKIFFIAYGAVRCFRYYKQSETTLLLLTEGNFVTSITPFLTGTNSYSHVVATENTFGLYIDLVNYKALIKHRPDIYAAFTVGLSKMLYFHQKLSEILRLDAETKFDFIQNILPQVVNRFQLNHQASFIGLKPETLSRVRSGFARKSAKKH